MFGAAIVDGDRTVIPVAEARFGLGAGDGLIARGVGGGMTAKPLGFIVIDRNGVRFQRTPRRSLAPLALGVVIGLALAMRLTRPPRPRIAGQTSPRTGGGPRANFPRKDFPCDAGY